MGRPRRSPADPQIRSPGVRFSRARTLGRAPLHAPVAPRPPPSTFALPSAPMTATAIDGDTPAPAPPAPPVPRSSGPPKWLTRTLVTVISLVVLIVGFAVGSFVLHLRRPEKVQTFEQPATVSYADNSSHVAVLWHVETVGSQLGLSGDHYE